MKTIETDVGKNKTGIMTSLKEAMKTEKGAVELTDLTPGDSSALGNNRIRYMLEGDPLGTLPPPAGLKGFAASVKEKVMTGNHTFMDKLGERIAFERTGTRLYEALLSKYHGTEDKSVLPPLNMLEQFYLEELKHFNLAAEVMLKLGGDPTAMTPSADVCGVAGAGWVQVIGDPRTTFLQSLEIILQAELVDNACWENIIEMAEKLGQKDAIREFQVAKEEEDIHLLNIKRWVKELNQNGRVSLLQ